MKKNVFFWRILIVSIFVLLLANIVSLAAYTYVGKNAYINLEIESLLPEAEFSAQAYTDFRAGEFSESVFKHLIEKQASASDSAILIADEIGNVLVFRSADFPVDADDFAIYFDKERQTVLHGDTITLKNLIISKDELAIGIGIPIYKGSSVTGGVFIIKQMNKIRTAFQRLSDTLMLSILLVLPLVMVFLIFSSNRITKPLSSMANVAIKMSAGDFVVRADENYSGEVGTLARALNKLCDNLSRTIIQLQNEKTQLNELIRSFSDGVAAIDESGTLTHYNPALKALFGTVNVHSRHDLVPDAAVWAEFDKAIELKEPRTMRYDTSGARSLWISIVPLIKETGHVCGAVGLFKDVTEFERLEQTRREYVANISHELRTPITAVRGLLEPLADGMIRDDETRTRYYGIMLHEIDRLSRLITDMLQLSRLQSGTEYMEKTVIDVGELLEETAMSFKGETDKRGIDLILSVESGLSEVLTDRDRIEQILVILIDNAMRYTPSNGSITISAINGERVLVSVTDTGCGIKKEALPHLFERFYKVDKSRKDGGSGLGLAIAKQIIDNLGEQISVESTEGIGTSFHFTLKKYVRNAIPLGPTSDSDSDMYSEGNISVFNEPVDAGYEIVI